MKKMLLTLLAAVTVAVGTFTFAAPTQAFAATTAITPEWNEDWVVGEFYFDTYPPRTYTNNDIGYYGELRYVTPLATGGYIGTYYGYWF